MTGLAGNGVFVAGSDRPECETVRVGFMPLTDCASVVMASVLGFDEKYGIRIVLSKEHSWSGMRDKLVNGELDAAHVLYGLVYGVHLGIGARQKAMAVLMNLNRNGQAITLARPLAVRGAVDGAALAQLMRDEPRRYVFGHTFPTGNHAMLLYYWLAAAGIDPLHDVHVVTVPPSQMVATLAAGHMDGFCAGEPWGQRAVLEKVGVTVASSQQVWPGHPGKALGATAEFVDRNPHASRALTAAIIEAGRWIETSVANRQAAAEVLASPAYVNVDRELIEPRLHGEYEDGLGNSWRNSDGLQFYGDGEVNFPYLSDGMWFMTQHRRWGLLQHEPDYRLVAEEVNRVALYRGAAALAGAPVPQDMMRSSTLIDGKCWDGSDPAAYASAFPIRHRS
jgi:ABC-type nitrate/sulfonate/bicarbonate transport system substrate-binding protein